MKLDAQKDEISNSPFIRATFYQDRVDKWVCTIALTPMSNFF